MFERSTFPQAMNQAMLAFTPRHTQLTPLLCLLSVPHVDFSYSNMCVHKALKTLKQQVDLDNQCGYITMLNPNTRHRRRASDSTDYRGVWERTHARAHTKHDI